MKIFAFTPYSHSWPHRDGVKGIHQGLPMSIIPGFSRPKTNQALSKIRKCLIFTFVWMTGLEPATSWSLKR